MRQPPIDPIKWLNQPPKKSEIVEIQVGKDKVKVIPEKTIESLLDELTGCTWSIINFKSSRFPQNGKVLMDASLVLVVKYGSITRHIVGAITFDTAFFGNTYHNNTAKSLCIVNAASELGKRFGKDLNPNNIIPVYGGNTSEHDKIKATLAILKEDLANKTIG